MGEIELTEQIQKDNRLLPFFLITFLWSWLMWLPNLLATYDISILDPVRFLGFLAVFGPSAAAIILTAKNEGSQGVKTLLKRGWSLNFQKKWLFPAL